MTTTPPEAPPANGDPGPDQGPRVSRDEVRDLGRMRRTTGRDRKLAGVAGGLARHLDIDPIIVRVALVVLIFFGGAGVLVYAACWLLVPSEDRAQATVPLDDRNRTIALVVVGGIATLALLGDSIGQWGFPWPLILIAVIALVVLAFVDKERRPTPSAPPVPHTVDPVTGAVTPLAPPGQPFQTYRYETAVRPSRRRGPILFLFTMLLAALGCGVLAILDAAGMDVVPAAYPAVVLVTCGVMLVVGSFYGRPGGLILVGLVSAVAMLTAAVIGPWHGSGDLRRSPDHAAAVQSEYRLSAGEIVLDLTEVTDPAALDGRTVHLEGRAGRIEVVVPAGLSVRVHGHVRGAGHMTLFGLESDGVNAVDEVHHVAGVGAPEITIDGNLVFGEIDVHTEGSAR